MYHYRWIVLTATICTLACGESIVGKLASGDIGGRHVVTNEDGAKNSDVVLGPGSLQAWLALTRDERRRIRDQIPPDLKKPAGIGTAAIGIAAKLFANTVAVVVRDPHTTPATVLIFEDDNFTDQALLEATSALVEDVARYPHINRRRSLRVTTDHYVVDDDAKATPLNTSYFQTIETSPTARTALLREAADREETLFITGIGKVRLFRFD